MSMQVASSSRFRSQPQPVVAFAPSSVGESWRRCFASLAATLYGVRFLIFYIYR